MRFAAVLGLLALLLGFLPAASPAQAAVIVSELADPQDNYLTDRFIEIANTGTSAVDLTGWRVVAVGNSVDIFTWNLSGSIQPGDALVAGDATLTVSFTVDFPAEAWSTSNSTWNGKVGDGAKLYNGATLIDYVVVPGTAFENMDYVRNQGVTSPSTTYNAAEWTATAISLPTDGTPGSHWSSPSGGPTITDIVTDPAAPLPGQTVNVEAGVTDASHTITSVIARWGTSSGSLPNTISMSLQSGSTYRTTSAIPAQAGGTTVYYTVEATNNVPATTVSTERSYALTTPVSIYAIQGQATSSPYAGTSVMTSGTVTAVYGTTYVIQDAAAAWHGLWAVGATAPSVGDTILVQGLVTETYGSGLDGNTVLSGAVVLSATPAVATPAPVPLSTSGTISEGYEGVLVAVSNAQCTVADLGGGEWAANDGSGPTRVGERGFDGTPIRGTRYNVTGPLGYSSGAYKLEPRAAGDVVWVGDTFAPLLLQAEADGLSSVRVYYSEPVDPVTGATKAYYSIPGVSIQTAQIVSGHSDQVLLTVNTMSTGTFTLTITGVQDPYGNVVVGASDSFGVTAYSPPAGYYASAAGLTGDDLRMALHLIIDNHTVKSYDYALIAFHTTDDKPNGKVWDMYSDVPGGTPPYEYTFDVDSGGSADGEGDGYNREHSWPKSWFNDASPMASDLFQLYPTDIYVNGMRSNYPYGEVTNPTWTSQNGSKRGPCSYPGYTGVVFEPIDAYKGDLARTYFYMSTRYYTEDGSWPGSDMVDGCTLKPWALDLLMEWHQQDPVSEKELERNHAVYGFQGNRNPFIDHPEYVTLMYGEQGAVEEAEPAFVRLLQNVPNPFFSSTAIAFDLAKPGEVTVEIYDLQGRLVRELLDEPMLEGSHRVTWDGRDASGRPAAAGVYFYGVHTPEGMEARRMVLMR